MFPLNALLVVVGIVLNVLAQAALKTAVTPLAGLAAREAVARLPGLCFDPWLIGGLALYAISVVNWLLVLSRMDLSLAYPLMSGGYVLALLIGAWRFHEPITTPRVLGVATICVGIMLISRKPAEPVALAEPAALPTAPAATPTATP